MKRLLALLLCCAALLTLFGCKPKSSGTLSMIVELPAAPTNLDPQLARTVPELATVQNCFEGLMRTDASGADVCAAAASYRLSDDGLTYTFTLRPDARWWDGTFVTAGDFVFALRRAVSPDTAAPFAQRLAVIAGAEDILRGKASPATLAATASTNRTLTIRLVRPCADFLHILTTSVCMPNNPSFFDECQGKFGLDIADTLGNGSFMLSSWSRNAIALKRNANYSGDFIPALTAATLSIFDDPQNAVSRLVGGNTSAAFADTVSLPAARSAHLNISSAVTTTWAIVLNPLANGFTDARVRDALMKALDRPACVSFLPKGYTLSARLIPAGATIDGAAYKRAKPYAFPSDIPEALAEYNQALKKQHGALPKTAMLYLDTPDMKAAASYAVQSWQKNLGAYINIQPLSLGDLMQKVAGGTYSIALIPLTGDDGTALEFCQQFASARAVLSSNIYHIQNEAVDALLASVTPASAPREISQAVEQIEDALLQSGQIIPLFDDGAHLICSPNWAGVRYDPFGGQLDLALAQRKGA